jgi:hypothetical protein
LVIETSTELTVVVVVALSFSGDGSVVVVLMVAVLTKVVPEAVPLGIFPTSVKFPEAPAGSEAIVQLTKPFAPTAGVVHAYPAGALSDTNVMVPGSGSLKATFAAALGPLLKTVRL